MNQLRQGIQYRRTVIIDELIRRGINEAADGRAFHELTLTELETEWQRYTDRQGMSHVLMP